MAMFSDMGINVIENEEADDQLGSESEGQLPAKIEQSDHRAPIDPMTLSECT